MSTKFHPLADLFPLMEGAEFEELVTDIKAHGLREPVVVFEDMILDGRNRARACEASDVEPAYTTYSGDDPAAYVVSANLHRRHLTAEQKRDLIAKLVKEQPEKSNRQIAKVAKVDDKTVASVRDELEAGAEIPHLNETTGADGKSYPTKKRKKKRKKPTRRERETAQAAAATEAKELATAKAKELIDKVGIDVVKRVLAALDEPYVWDALDKEIQRRAMNGAAAGPDQNVDRWSEGDTL